MLESIYLKNLGPAAELTMDLAPRLNLITGDNGLGKTLLLDSVWWALTRTWPMTWGGKGVVPAKDNAEIEWTERRGELVRGAHAQYDFGDSAWKRTEGYPASAGVGERERLRQDGELVVYLRVDGGISVHDPLRIGEDFRLAFGMDAYGKSSAFQFRDADIWDGLELRGDKAINVCEGLVRDVSRWALQPGNAEFDQLAGLVTALAGEEQFRLLRKTDRVYVDDSRDFPVVSGPTGELSVAHAPAGLRRILGLAYIVVWAWHEHGIAAALKKRPPTGSLVVLIDEVESHLHPKWQRTILPSLIRALGADVQLQILATTHSPMVLASVESSFDANLDAWFDLDLEGQHVELGKRPYVRLGEVGNWLTSDAFDLKEPRSLEGERAVRAAQDVLHAKRPTLAEIDAADQGLRNAGLPDIDPFWVRWDYFVGQAKGAAPQRENA
jgi:hypothetical protein